MESSFSLDVKARVRLDEANALNKKRDYGKAIAILEDLIETCNKEDEAWRYHAQLGHLYVHLADTLKPEDDDLGFAYVLGCAGIFSEYPRMPGICANTFFTLARMIKSKMYGKKCISTAKAGLAGKDMFPEFGEETKKSLEKQIKIAEFMIKAWDNIHVGGKASEVRESEKRSDPPQREHKGLRSFWVGLDAEDKRAFMKVSIEKLKVFVEQMYETEGREVLENVLSSAEKDKKWGFWICRGSCEVKSSSAEDCKKHLELKHAPDFEPSLEKDRVKRIGKDWARKISDGGWKPVDVEAAVQMIKNRLDYVKSFASTSKDGWAEEWPLAVDEERSKLLQEIKSFLVSYSDLKILPCSFRDWLMRFPVRHLGKLHVSEQVLIESNLDKTPQSICFLERQELCQIRDFLKKLKWERKDGTDIVCRAVDSIFDRTRVREKIDFDSQFSLVLLDRRLLKSNNDPFKYEGSINFIDDPNVHYTKAFAHGDDIISWLADHSSVDKNFPVPTKEYNIEIWVAVKKAVQFTCRTMKAKYAKKVQLLDYEAALTDVENMCMSEEKGRENPRSTSSFLCVVRDALKGASHLTLDFPDLEECLSVIREHKSLSDDLALGYIKLLKSMVTHKLLQIDSKILLIDNSRISLLNDLTRLSFFDNRSYMLRVLKPFVLNEISVAWSDAVKAELLLEDESKKPSKEKTSVSKKKKNKINQKTSRSVSIPLDKTAEHEPSPSLKTVGEESIASERVRLEISSKEATEVDPDMQNTPGEDSQLALGGASARHSSALDMTLKALLSFKFLKEDLKDNEQPSYEDHKEQVTCALQKVVAAFKLGVLEGVYGVLLSDLLDSIKQKQPSMSGSAAELFVIILQFWPCWKDPGTESLVNRFFMLEENERMSCRKCRREPNYPEQRSYGIVMAADSIRDLKCAFGNMKFVDILKLIRMEHKMLCDITKGGCGETNFVQHFMSTNPHIFTIVLEWEKSETGKEISETTKALEWEIDISSIYEDLEPNTNYRLVSMVGCGEEDEHVCLAYGNNGWVNVMRDSLAKEDVGNWESMIRFCEERMVQPKILFYEGVWASSSKGLCSSFV